ncbi:MAG: RDD family protein [Pseudomonadota bacterium]
MAVMQDALQIQSITGVDVELPIAGPGGRSYAFVIDWHIRLLLTLAWYVVGTLALFGTVAVADMELSSSSFIFAVVLPAAAIYFLYHPVLEVLMQGRTPGKRFAGLRIVTREGEIPGIGAIMLRNVLRLVDSLPAMYAVGLTACVLTSQSVRIGDMAAGTVLIYDPESDAEALSPIATDAIAEVGLENLQLASELLDRWESLDVARARDLGLQLLARMGNELPATAAAADVRRELMRIVERS